MIVRIPGLAALLALGACAALDTARQPSGPVMALTTSGPAIAPAELASVHGDLAVDPTAPPSVGGPVRGDFSTANYVVTEQLDNWFASEGVNLLAASLTTPVAGR